MKSYRDYLDRAGVPRGPWVVDGPRFASNDTRAQEAIRQRRLEQTTFTVEGRA
jgi:hypothetical protein